MRIIGVIDLKDGQAVHARGGRREAYTAVSGAAGTVVNGDAVALARVYRDTFRLSEIYIADLNAIASGAPHDDVITRLSQLGVTLLVDAGIATRDDGQRVVQAGADIVVVGLETLDSFDALRGICRGGYDVSFSLDLRDGVPMHRGAVRAGTSPEEIARLAVDAGASAIFVLDVARVGAAAGPDLQMLRRIRTAVHGSAVLAAGGVRGGDDLRQLADIGCQGALVATALHDGRLTRSDVVAAGLF